MFRVKIYVFRFVCVVEFQRFLLLSLELSDQGLETYIRNVMW